MMQCHLHAAFASDSQPSSSGNSHFLSGNGGGEGVGWVRGRNMGGKEYKWVGRSINGWVEVWVAVVLVGAEVGEVGVGEVGLNMEEMEVKESGTHLMAFDLVVVVEVASSPGSPPTRDVDT